MAERNGWSMAQKIIAVILGAAAVFTLTGAIMVKLMDLETEAAHRADIDRVERKLDCALFQLPRNCMDTLSPR